MNIQEIVPEGAAFRYVERTEQGRIAAFILFPVLAEARQHLLDRLDNPTDEEIEEHFLMGVRLRKGQPLC